MLGDFGYVRIVLTAWSDRNVRPTRVLLTTQQPTTRRYSGYLLVTHRMPKLGFRNLREENSCFGRNCFAWERLH